MRVVYDDRPFMRIRKALSAYENGEIAYMDLGYGLQTILRVVEEDA